MQCAVRALASQIAVSCSEARCKRFIPSSEGAASCVQSVCVSARAALADKANRLPSSLGLKLQIPVRLKGTSMLTQS